ncbi:MAG: hypothetical protein QOE36_2546 [Gaiellaceae bacterium]|nr:hypothetical protein [Gaiellaceae bacterium]
MRIKALVLALFGATFVLALPAAASAASFSVLHSFSGPDGETPAAPLIQGADGFVYGVAAHGGNFSVLPPDGGGTVFRTSLGGTLTTLHTFAGSEGAVPSSLIQGRDGLFYGTTTYGGQQAISSLEPGTGTIFRMNGAGVVTVLHVFQGGSEGRLPGPIVQGADGALYGHALGGVGWGFVYRFDPITGAFRHLHDFVSSDGKFPAGPLFQGSDQSFYGTTRQGGLWNSGVVYKVDVLGNFVALHSLSPFYPGEGSEAKGGVIQASDGFFYGTTESGYGSVFRMDAAGNFTVLHRFDAYASDGWRPVSGLIEGRDGFLYGTAPSGGRDLIGAPSPYGVVYRMNKSGAFTLLRSFTGPDGRMPLAALMQGVDGLLYGSTAIGGASGLGVLFRMEPVASTPAPLPTLLELMFSPSNVVGGQSSTGWVTLGGPAPSGGAVVTLSSSLPAVVSVPPTMTVPAGAWRASFAVPTSRVKQTRTATITAGYNAGSVSARLTVTR